jgi:integrase
MILLRVRQLFRWAADPDNNYIERNYSSWVPRPKGAPAERTAIPLDALAKLMDAAGQSKFPKRDQAILAVLIGTAIRRAECVALNVEDVSLAARQIAIRHGKGDRPRPVVFDDRTACYLAAHLEEMNEETGPLWRTFHDRRLGFMGIYDMVKRTLARAGLEPSMAAPHDFRRLFATCWNRGRKGLAAAGTLSKQLGHTNAATTLRYVLTDMDDVRQAYRSPFDLVDAD